MMIERVKMLTIRSSDTHEEVHALESQTGPLSLALATTHLRLVIGIERARIVQIGDSLEVSGAKGGAHEGHSQQSDQHGLHLCRKYFEQSRAKVHQSKMN